MMHYRIWDKRNNIYRPYMDDWAIKSDGTLLIKDGEFFEVNIEQFKVEWGSGILDKHGNEIFEGDIIKMPCSDYVMNNFGDKSIVKYNNGGFELVSVLNGKVDCDLWENYKAEILIIGNINKDNL